VAGFKRLALTRRLVRSNTLLTKADCFYLVAFLGDYNVAFCRVIRGTLWLVKPAHTCSA
jgi:hypothetical protein